MLDGEVREQWVRDVDSGRSHHIFVLPSSGRKLPSLIFCSVEELLPPQPFHVMTHAILKIRFEGAEC
uniref:Uncharacterized protein n=1 Tax=Parascaris equorum TaxID=6256 RepID=A0A914RZL9_PAREQ